MTRSDPQVKFYVPQPLKDEIEAAAKKNGRSMSAEIVARLQASFEEGKGSVASALPSEFRKQIESVLLDYIEQGKISAGKKPKG